MNMNFKNNRAYGIGFNDGYQKGINDCEEVLFDVKSQLQEERVINKTLQKDYEKVKVEYERIGLELSEQTERIDDLEVTVDNVLDVLNGLQTEYDNNSSKMKAIMVKRDSMESANKEIDKLVNAVNNLTA